jgi:thioredoxin 1
MEAKINGWWLLLALLTLGGLAGWLVTERGGDSRQQAAPPAEAIGTPDKSTIGSHGLTVVDDSNFQKVVLESTRPVVVDFFATWCIPCQRLAPVLEQVAQEIPEVLFVKLDVDQSPHASEQCEINGMPTLILFKGGKMVLRSEGLISISDLRSFARR